MSACRGSSAPSRLRSSVAAPVRAETIILTSGALDWPGHERRASAITMSGDGFSFIGATSTSFGIFGPRDQCGFPVCTNGTTVNLVSRFSGGSLGGTATYNGVTYSPVGSLAANASLDARWSGGLTIPADFIGGVLTAPFQFAGEFYYNHRPAST